ncbi:molybdopterin converting factor [Anditalea andensis]|uniref:Molybdopterin converting factor n=1 Tax=Anditalea andensis TaxID=1048983 RepID=A0A074L3S3_9BACT|nr:molybdopterin converting factor [Anditalea andensis]
MKVRAFGMIAEKLPSNELELENIANTDQLLGYLYQQYPALKHTKFSIAVNRKQVHGNELILPESEVALLPPFSGG